MTTYGRLVTFEDVKEAELYVGGFSAPSKMPCKSYSIPTRYCNIGQKMRNVPGSVCSKCYACKGRYGFQNVQDAQERRYKTINKPFWAEAIAFCLNTWGEVFFRWHDSGEIQNVEHLQKIVKVALLCPNTKFWLPTREVGIVQEYLENFGTFPDNLIVRVSGTMIDGPPPRGFAETWGLAVSTVTTCEKEATCRAFENAGKCGFCRKCWDRSVETVTYLAH